MDTMTGTTLIDYAGTQGGRGVRGDPSLQEETMQTSHPDRDPVREDRMVGLLEALHGIRFMPDITSLVALGTSATTVGRRQRALGLDRSPLVNGGCAVATFRTGVPHLTGRADLDPEELRGLVEGLGVRSVAACAIRAGGECRGVLSVASVTPDAFRERDLRELGAVAGWAGLVMERAELVRRLAAAAERRGYERAGHELARLTARQRAVAALVADGRTNAEIAASLGLTEGTVANHMEQALRRLELRSRAQLAVWAYRHGLYRPDDDTDEPSAPTDATRERIDPPEPGSPCQEDAARPRTDAPSVPARTHHQQVNPPQPRPLRHEGIARRQQGRDAEHHPVDGHPQRSATNMVAGTGPRTHAGDRPGRRSCMTDSGLYPSLHVANRDVPRGSQYPSFFVPDGDVPHQPGTPVRVDRASTQVQIIDDPDGEYEVVSCRPATELGADPPMLRVNLRWRG